MPIIEPENGSLTVFNLFNTTDAENRRPSWTPCAASSPMRTIRDGGRPRCTRESRGLARPTTYSGGRSTT
ncbi:hypothetical protein ACR6C2_25985 [Streptomyces sp. INA 01156]